MPRSRSEQFFAPTWRPIGNPLVIAGVEIIRSSGSTVFSRPEGPPRGVVEQADIGGKGLDQHRRGEVAGIPGVELRVLEWCVGEADARAELVGADELPAVWSKRQPPLIVNLSVTFHSSCT